MGVIDDLEIRFAVPADLTACVAADDLAAAIVRRKIDADEIIVSVAAGDTIGYLRLEYLWCKMPFVGLIRVQPDRRGQGVGRRMLGFLEAHLRVRGCGFLLSSSMADAPAAQGWHRKMGFSECGFLAGVNGGDVGEVFFRKALG